jgi:hypothetical protein
MSAFILRDQRVRRILAAMDHGSAVPYQPYCPKSKTHRAGGSRKKRQQVIFARRMSQW